MDSYSSSYRENGSDRGRPRDDTRGREDRGDSFYRGGRSPGMKLSTRKKNDWCFHREHGLIIFGNMHTDLCLGGDRRERRRSRSPGPFDRYEPRGRRDGRDGRDDRERDERRRLTPPTNIDRYVPGHDAGAAAPVTMNPLLDPVKLPYQVGFSYFGEWWRMNEKVKDEKERARTGRRREPERPRGVRESQEERDMEKAKIQSAYDAYKEDLQAKTARMFVAEHRKEEWFRERYISEVRDEIRNKVNEARKGVYTQWEQDLESGTFDEFSLEGILKSDTNGAGGVVEKEAGETNEVLGVADLVPASNVELRDENLYQPTLLIKTIAPNVSRRNLEAFCKEHLGEEEGGFQWLSLSDPNPSKRFHRIGWVMLHPSSDTAAPVERDDPKDEDGDEQISTPPPVSTAERALEAINGKTVKDELRGDFVCHVGVHNPPSAPRKKALWDLFSAPERIEKDLQLVHRIVNKFEEDFGSDFQAILKVEEKVEELKNTGRLQLVVPPTSAAKKTKREIGMDEAMDEAAEEGQEDEEDEEEGAIEDEEEVDDEDLLLKKKQLDLLIEYLRRVFNFCFFCVFESDSVHELTRKCPGGHLRRPRNTLTGTSRAVARASASGEPFPSTKKDKDEPIDEGEIEGGEIEKKSRNPPNKTEVQLLRAYNWVKTFEDKLGQILDPLTTDIKKLGGRNVDEAVEEELAKHVRQEDDHKWRCKAPDCTKLFKEEHFWKKHVEKRHVDWLDSLRQEVGK